MVKLACGLIAEETAFGWTLGGMLPENPLFAFIVMSKTSPTQEIEKLWSLEAIGILDSAYVQTSKEEEIDALRHFNETVSRDREGRYVVALPWRSTGADVPSNRNVAEKRLRATTYNLLKANKFEVYDKVFKDWLSEGLIKMVAGGDDGHYIPHRPIFKNSLTTPVRPVFDASCKMGRNRSLNDCLYKGPNLIELIPVMIMRFGKKPFGVTADIRKAFQMLNVRETDQKYQRFLWWENTTREKLVVFQHCRVVFGITSSPFLLGAAIKYHLESFGNNGVAKQLTDSFYVDNLVTSLDSAQEYESFHEQSREIMSKAKMELRDWATTVVETEKGESEIVMPVLGVMWNREKDFIYCSIKEISIEGDLTKRIMLSVVAQIFDPMGWLAPAVLIPKLLIQETWSRGDKKHKLKWDEKVPDDIDKAFRKWLSEITVLEQVQIPRHCQVLNSIVREIHIFGDSSKVGIGAVAFLKTMDCGAVAVQFIMAKSRLTPVKRMTIPRSELVACVIATRIGNVIKKVYDENVSFLYYTDSSTALSWITRNGDWGVFVQNRTKEISNSTEIGEWHFVAGVNNPADLPSRGAKPSVLLASKWHEGPEWLYNPNFEGFTCTDVDEDEVNKELKKSVVMVNTIETMPEPPFSSYRRNVAMWGWVLRFIRNCKEPAKCKSRFLTIAEVRAGEKVLLRTVQDDVYAPNCKSIGGLELVKSESDGLLRMKTRLGYRNDHEDFKFPIVLPNKHPIVTLLIMEVHLFNCHGGVQFLVNKLREKYWVIRSRQAVRRVLRTCVKCRRHSSKNLEVVPAPLPTQRVEDVECFTTTGVDLAGPLFLKDGRKAWIVLYTCAVYRAVYLDLVCSLSTEAFLLSLERFISIHGRPNTLWSDNGTNFVGSESLMNELAWEEITAASQQKQIQWVFNPPTASWWGGFWERLVRSVKDLLKRMIGRSRLSYDELRTCIAGASATINDRPLTVVTEDANDLAPLTPAMFVRPRYSGHLVETGEAERLSESYRRMKEHQAKLQARFRKEYLSLLVTRVGKKQQEKIEVGDVVLVGFENRKRYEWPLGLVTELPLSKDGKQRVAKIKTSSGILLRPLQRLYPLEISKREKVEPSQTIVEEELEGENLIDDFVPLQESYEAPVVTRSGREVRKPIRYAAWMHLVE